MPPFFTPFHKSRLDAGKPKARHRCADRSLLLQRISPLGQNVETIKNAAECEARKATFAEQIEAKENTSPMQSDCTGHMGATKRGWEK